MYVWDLLRQFLIDMRARKLRTLLALFGIAWGTIAVILLQAIGGAFHAASQKAMHGMGESLVIVWPGRTTLAFAGMQPGRPLGLKAADVVELGRQLPEIGLCSPELIEGNRALRANGHRTTASIAGVAPEYERMRNLIAEPGGRFLNTLDLEQRRRAVFIGDAVRDKLFPDEEAVGRTLLVDGRPFTVVGVLQKKLQTSNYAGQDADRAFIPHSTFIAVWGDRQVSNFILRPEPPHASEPMKAALYRYLGEKYRFDPADEGTLGIWDTVEVDHFTNWFFWGLQALLGLGGALTLGAGGIGVANIMYLVVRERTREIGVRMAVGARPAHILFQVLFEALLVVALGGLLGFAFSALAIALAQVLSLPEWLGQPRLSAGVGLLTCAILAAVGLAAGLFPARRAARLDPVRALEAGR